MAYVVADPCVKCKYTDCVAVCPVDCFYEGKNSLAINPDECIDCGACEPECPTTAIFEESELPSKLAVYKDINALVSGAKKAGDVDSASWPSHLKDGAARSVGGSEPRQARPASAAAARHAISFIDATLHPRNPCVHAFRVRASYG